MVYRWVSYWILMLCQCRSSGSSTVAIITNNPNDNKKSLCSLLECEWWGDLRRGGGGVGTLDVSALHHDRGGGVTRECTDTGSFHPFIFDAVTWLLTELERVGKAKTYPGYGEARPNQVCFCPGYTKARPIRPLFPSLLVIRKCVAMASLISPSDSASHWSFAYYNGILGNISVADGALILHMIT